MTIDRLRLAEAATTAALTLGLITLPPAVSGFNGVRAAILVTMLAILISAVYALHAVTFDCFRLTGQRRSPLSSYTRSEE